MAGRGCSYGRKNVLLSATRHALIFICVWRFFKNALSELQVCPVGIVVGKEGLGIWLFDM